MSLIQKKAGGLFQKLGSNKLMAKFLAKKISKEDFLEELKDAWSEVVNKNSDVERELKKAQERIKKSGYEDVFKTVGITEDDLRKVITDIKNYKPEPISVERKQGRNEPCNCGSGKKYKYCCGK